MIRETSLARRITLIIMALGYVAMFTAVCVGVWQCRTWAEKTYGSATAKADWEDWKQQARESSQSGPVVRKVTDSKQPPLALLFREHFWVMLAGAVGFTSLIYAATSWLIYGMAFGHGSSRTADSKDRE